jgi:hypothetical protein
LRNDNARRAKEPSRTFIPRLLDLDNRARLDVPARRRDHVHSLVPTGVERSTGCLYPLYAILAQQLQHGIPRDLYSLQQRRWGRVSTHGQRTVQVVGDREYLEKQAVLCFADLVLRVSPLALAKVVHLGLQAQGTVLPRCLSGRLGLTFSYRRSHL